MGIFDIFKSGPSEDSILGQVRKAKEVYAQPEYRRMAMEKLLKWNTDESLRGVLERFCVVVQSPHWDEDEKRWLVEEFINLGDRAIPLLKEFILKKDEVNHALIAFRKVAGDEQYKKVLIEALAVRLPSDHRSVQGKQEIIAAMSEFENAFEELLVPYLDDHSDDVQCATIDALGRSENPAVHRRLIELLSSDVHSARVLRTAANVVVNREFSLGANTQLSEVVKEDFMLDSGVLVRLRHEGE